MSRRKRAGAAQKPIEEETREGFRKRIREGGQDALGKLVDLLKQASKSSGIVDILPLGGGTAILEWDRLTISDHGKEGGPLTVMMPYGTRAESIIKTESGSIWIALEGGRTIIADIKSGEIRFQGQHLN